MWTFRAPLLENGWWSQSSQGKPSPCLEVTCACSSLDLWNFLSHWLQWYLYLSSGGAEAGASEAGGGGPAEEVGGVSFVEGSC